MQAELPTYLSMGISAIHDRNRYGLSLALDGTRLVRAVAARSGSAATVADRLDSMIRFHWV